MGISVSINAGKDKSSSSVHATGSSLNIITDNERKDFNIEDAALKRAIATYFGLAPDDAYVCSPTLWNDLYKTYGWRQIQTLYTVASASIISLTSEPTIVATQTFENQSSKEAHFETSISQEVTVTTESSWSQSSTVEEGQTISYGINFLGAGAGGETNLNYSETWGQAGSKSESITLGTSSGFSVELQPGQSVVADLTSSKGKLTVKIDYQQTLSGSTAINYKDPYKGHHFYALDINAVMSAAGYPTSIRTTETIEIDFYADSKIVVRDQEGKAIASFVVSPQHA